MPLTRCIQMHSESVLGLPTPALTCASWGVHLQDTEGGGGGACQISQQVGLKGQKPSEGQHYTDNGVLDDG